MPCSGCTGAIPRHYALHLDRVWRTCPQLPINTKERAEESGGKKRKTWGTDCKRREKQQKVREEEELFEREERLRKKQRGKGNQTWDFFERQRRESESIRGEEKNRDWWSQHKEEEGPFLTPRAPPLCFLSTATAALPFRHHQRCQRQQNQRGRRETEQNREKENQGRSRRGEKKNHNSNLELAVPSANHHWSFSSPPP